MCQRGMTSSSSLKKAEEPRLWDSKEVRRGLDARQALEIPGGVPRNLGKSGFGNEVCRG